MSLRLLVLVSFASAALAQITPMDVQFAGLSARTRQLAYTAGGGDMKAIAPLMVDAGNADRVRAYRSLTHAMVLMSGAAWTPDRELATGLDFAIGAKLVGTGENLAVHATWLFDAPAAENGPYRMRLELMKPDGSKEADAPGIVLGDVRGRKAGETTGIVFDPSKVVQQGLHTAHAVLEDGHGTKLFDYYRSFFVVPDLQKRVDTLTKTLELLADQKAAAALAARQVLETVGTAHQAYYGTGFQNLCGWIFTGMRNSGLGLKEAMDYDAALARAAQWADALAAGRDPLAGATGDLHLAYRSGFDGKLVPYRVYLPATYHAGRKYPLILLLHGAGGDETDFLEGYRGTWPKAAEEHGYILAAVSGRGPVSGYAKANGAEQDVLDVLELVKARYSVDAARVYLGGHSMGSAGTWRIGLTFAERFAGLIPIAGTSAAVLPGLELQMKTGAKKLPVLMVCGEKDALVAVTGCREVAERAKGMGAPVEYKEYPGQDHLSVVPAAVTDVFRWLENR
jgi:predicted esterase